MAICQRFAKLLIRSRRSLCSSGLPAVQFLEVTEPKPYVFHVRLNRPERRNAFTLPLWEELHSVFDHLSSNSKCRAVVLSGAGKSFCAGIDLQEGITGLISIVQDESLDVARKSRRIRDLIGACQGSFSSLEQCTKPVIASLHGHCIGAGISLIASADIRYASSDAIFSIREVDIGLAADVGILNRINKLVGNDSLTRELAFTARDIGSSEALKYGLISRQFASAEECLEASLALAVEIAARSPIAVQGSKLTLNYARDHPIEDSINFIRTWNQSQLQSEDLIRAAMAAMSKKKPDFNDI
ncbi:Delta(3,5)-Delta(2,4)-dienoyl-CoA isomerase, mitochondrial [Toxocara canis]|uniref:Delta(3,5)-Delta(2,4)-dienoyl-CoA isomerase, mitochondrial n=1 Tax=Toxocara canis TaxID=6265 RepID=A0A0B2VH57_TOXCA|nr:Delta(3,5)-Delta(2,4)-dienoyl-CoA isomerase, mitochondrial [Toxocara canis]